MGIPQVEVTKLEARLASNRELMLVHFHSPLASGCHLVHSVFELVEPRYRGRVEFSETEVPLLDLDAVRSFRITEVPTILLFEGRTEVERLEKVVSPEELAEILDLCSSFYGGGPVGEEPFEEEGRDEERGGDEPPSRLDSD